MTRIKFALIVVLLSIGTLGRAEEQSNDKVHEVAASAKETAHKVAEGVREGAHKVAKAAKHVKNKVVTRCSDGRHTIRGASGCAGHGGVAPVAE